MSAPTTSEYIDSRTAQENFAPSALIRWNPRKRNLGCPPTSESKVEVFSTHTRDHLASRVDQELPQASALVLVAEMDLNVAKAFGVEIKAA